MAPYDDTTAATRFDSFNVYETHFKQIGDHKIKVAILVPKDLKPGKVPLAVKFHGGGLVVGDALFPDWIAAFWVPFMHRNNAITILPNYRLVPESSGADILEDLADFWSWFNDKGVDKYLTSQNVNVDLDYKHLLVSGDSAGGYMALQSGLTRPEGEINAILAQYPMTNHTRRSPEDSMLGMQTPSREWMDEKLASLLTPGAITSSAHPYKTDRFGLSMALNAYGRYNEFFGEGERLWPITAVKSVKFVPPTTIFHALGDSAVKFQDSVDFVERTKSVVPGVEIRLAYGKEGDHGFDGALKEDEEPWLKEELQWVESRWLF
ncbi:alpha/beta-hydrolase [Paraphaeosphaeria sporulosa]|uniref:Alpha/beta-hydrolase n=1 Tax=Paraphaeosphaeria sporulosa TaxID=1460663 RepID=A0A177CIY3_9PLEO|nr:alpha/beta-hydrolase [Paraphaeosphaeria sporulosa]OAG07463.1 alpha/beta-hydrolase [Paraphaeosphaeria sporulosa]